VIDEIALQVYRGNQHSDWLLSQPYRSSFTVPMYDNGGFLGFIFFDSTQPGYFDARVQRDLLLYCNLINMALSAELSAVRAVLVSAQVAREFVDLRDFETGAHLERMAQYARLIAKGVAADYQLSDETIEHIYLFAPLHDIGKIGIPDHILLKQGPLTSDERVFMQTHVEKGEQLMQKVIGDFGLHHLPDSEIMRHIVACHHEFLDGSGYPRGLRGDEIPAEARIVTVADIFDALTSQRPYKQPWSVEAALQELRTMADLGKLDRLCVEALAGQLATAQWIARHYVDKLPDELAKTTG
jgi:HD-GYP domain-containing protein (c-di-GMP phosphodiesterase class II)